VIDFIDMVLPSNRELLLRGLSSAWAATAPGTRLPR
jgi:Ribonuclease G/E